MQCEESMEHIDLGGSGGEFCAMAWMSPDEILNQVIAFRRSVYEKVLKRIDKLKLSKHSENNQRTPSSAKWCQRWESVEQRGHFVKWKPRKYEWPSSE